MRLYCSGQHESIAAFLKPIPVHLKYFLQKVFKPLESAWLYGIEVSAELVAELDIGRAFTGGEHNDPHFFQGIFPASDFCKAVESVFYRHIDVQKNNIRQAVFILIKCLEQLLPVTRGLYGCRQIQILEGIKKQQSVVFIVISYEYYFPAIMGFGHGLFFLQYRRQESKNLQKPV